MINQDNMLYALIKAKALTVENGVTISKMHNVQYLINQVLELSACGVFDRSEHDDFNEVVNKYKESKGDKMITEKEQKIVDAVNCLRGEWPFNESSMLVFPALGDHVIYQSDFNKFVREMREIDSSFQHPKINRYNHVKRPLLTKETSDYSYYEKEAIEDFINEPVAAVLPSGVNVSSEREGVQEVIQPVYTQAMKDAGEMPRVGMVVDIYDREVQNRFFDSVEIKFVSDYNIAFMSEDVEIAGSLSRFAIKPVDTRTPENKLIDEMMAVIWSAGCSVGQGQGEIIAKALIDEGYKK